MQNIKRRLKMQLLKKMGFKSQRSLVWFILQKALVSRSACPIFL